MPPKDEWIKMWYAYTTESYSATRKKEIMPFATKLIKFEDTMLSEISQTKEDKYCMVSVICGIRRKKIRLIE